VDWGDILRAAASFFLVLTGLALSYALVRLAVLLTRVAATVEVVGERVGPLLDQASTSLDQVNAQLVKVDRMTDSALDAVAAADHGVRAVVTTERTPLAKIAGLAAGIENGLGSFRARRRARRGGSGDGADGTPL
jgi:hypothetical protein